MMYLNFKSHTIEHNSIIMPASYVTSTSLFKITIITTVLELKERRAN